MSEQEEKIERMRQLVQKLNDASNAYYNGQNEVMTRSMKC
jgi:hypothetical protein